MKPQERAFQKWKQNADPIPYSWEDHEATFNAGFEAGVRYAFDTMGDMLLTRPENKQANCDAGGPRCGFYPSCMCGNSDRNKAVAPHTAPGAKEGGT